MSGKIKLNKAENNLIIPDLSGISRKSKIETPNQNMLHPMYTPNIF
jgi:hypothetical protein